MNERNEFKMSESLAHHSNTDCTVKLSANEEWLKLFRIPPCAVRLKRIANVEIFKAKCFLTKPCFVELSTEMSDAAVKRRPGRPPKSGHATPKAPPTPKPESTTPVAEKSSAKKSATKKNNAIDESAILSSGRSKRTPKPNPRYMDEAVFSATKAIKDDSNESETAEDGSEGILSSDEYRAPSDMPLKKRSLNQKSFGIKKHTPTASGGHAGRKSGSAIKRKLHDADIDIDDDHGKQLFLAAKRRLTHVS